MAKKRKRTPSSTLPTRGPLHQDALSLAILTALIDPEAVRQAGKTNTRPEEALSSALNLLWSVDDWLKGPSEKYYSHEDLEKAKNIRCALITQEWPLLDCVPFSMKEATNQDWCRHKTERNLSGFLKQNQYPFDYFKLRELPVYITREAYETALVKDRDRKREIDRERKRNIATGNSYPKNGKEERTSGKKASTSGK
jgi:hypothetical protein